MCNPNVVLLRAHGNVHQRGYSSNRAPAPAARAMIGADAPAGERIRNVRTWLVAITDFGDLAVSLPLAAAMLIWLLFSFSPMARWWVLALGVCIGVTALLKIVFYGCRPAGNIHSLVELETPCAPFRHFCWPV